MDSILLIGQSNMAGRGILTDVEPIAHKDLFMLRNGRWQPLHEPLHNDRPQAGIGLGASFALEYTLHYGHPVGLIPCAEGGSRLDEWEPEGQLFNHAVLQTRLAINVSDVKGILWHQGENDSTNEAMAHSYAPRYIATMNALRQALGLGDIPLVAGGLGDFLVRSQTPLNFFREVNRALMSQDVARALAPYGFAGAEGLTAHADNVHFDAASLRDFGKRYFAQYRKLRKKEE